MGQNSLRVKGDSNLPLGYHLLEKYDPIHRKRIFLISVIVWLFTGWLCILLNSQIQSPYDWNVLINRIITDYLHRFLIMGYGLLVVAVYGVIHEFIHAIFHWRFSHNWQAPRIQWRTMTPYAAIATGAYYSRNKFLLSTLSPLVIISILGFISWFLVPLTGIPVVILILSINFGAAVSDVPQALWARTYSRDALFGCENEYTVVYGHGKAIK